MWAGLVQELICESRTKWERKWKSGSTGNWSHGRQRHAGLLERWRRDGSRIRNGMLRTGDIGLSGFGRLFLHPRPSERHDRHRWRKLFIPARLKRSSTNTPRFVKWRSSEFLTPQWGELVTACVALKPGMALSANDLTTPCRQFLANYKIPRRVEFQIPSCRKAVPARSSREFCVNVFWAREERAVG